MDLNQSVEFNPSSIHSTEVHNFVPMSSFMLPYHHTSEEESEEASCCRFMQSQRENLELFWNQQTIEIQNGGAIAIGIIIKSNHQLPLARIKRVMKSGGDVKMISADTAILFSKACELFIMELTLRAWLQTEESKRRTLQRSDIARAIRHGGNGLHFLLEVVPYHDPKNLIITNHEYPQQLQSLC